MRMLSCLTAGLIAAIGVCFGFWLHGFNFDERGAMAIGCYLSALFAAAFAVAFTALSMINPPK